MELLELFELDGSQRKLIAEYSKGMRKRVAMAAALIHRPQLFLMDEPFEGVDAVGARLMKDILLEQVRHGATIFLTSHVLEVVERLCDRVAIINEGKLVLEGSMAELRGASETLEDAFVRAVGVDRTTETLDWLYELRHEARARHSLGAVADHAQFLSPRRRRLDRADRHLLVRILAHRRRRRLAAWSPIPRTSACLKPPCPARC